MPIPREAKLRRKKGPASWGVRPGPQAKAPLNQASTRKHRHQPPYRKHAWPLASWAWVATWRHTRMTRDPPGNEVGWGSDLTHTWGAPRPQLCGPSGGGKEGATRRAFFAVLRMGGRASWRSGRASLSRGRVEHVDRLSRSVGGRCGPSRTTRRAGPTTTTRAVSPRCAVTLGRDGQSERCLGRAAGEAEGGL